MFKGEKGQAYNASNPATFMSVKDLTQHLFDIFAPQLKIEFSTQDVAISQGYLPQRSLIQDINKLSSLGWKPITDLEEIYRIDISRFQAENKEMARFAAE